ncbi:hypothetical protein [Curtobacterium flaccumfaciens]|uniref:hypothetical protein n=1 Tax=Curtobacterium flaccumfaciens TaxID=2035 RepID=UPI0039934856
MRSTFFPITAAHRATFGVMTPLMLRRITGSVQQRQWGNELADQLEAANLNLLGDAPAGWGWEIQIPDDACPPVASWRTKVGSFSVHILRNARAAFQIEYSDRFAARLADLGDALERDGFARLDDAPAGWTWPPTGR